LSTHDSLITSKFNATSSAHDVVAGLDLGNLRAIVTGASSGIGFETARALAEVTLAVRNISTGSVEAGNIVRSAGNDCVRAAWLDPADTASVVSFVDGWNCPLHLLVDNAGIIPSTPLRAPEGW